MEIDLEQLRKVAEGRPIEGFPGYLIRKDGTVSSMRHWRGKIDRTMAFSADRYGYLRVSLVAPDGKMCRRQVHRLVCEAWHGPAASRLHQVRHLDGDKRNNSADNLAWGTAKENAADRDRHGTTARGEKNGSVAVPDTTVIASVELYRLGMPLAVLSAYIGIPEETLDNWASEKYRKVPTILALIARATTAEAEVARLRSEMREAERRGMERAAGLCGCWQDDDAIRAAVLMGMSEDDIAVAQKTASGLAAAIRAAATRDQEG